MRFQLGRTGKGRIIEEGIEPVKTMATQFRAEFPAIAAARGMGRRREASALGRKKAIIEYLRRDNVLIQSRGGLQVEVK